MASSPRSTRDSRLDVNAPAFAGAWDGSIKLWDVAQAGERLTLRGHTGPVAGLAFSSDSRLLASASYDQTVCVWDAETITVE